MKLIETYQNIPIYLDEKAKQKAKPYSTIQEVPILGQMETCHSSIKAAKDYIDMCIKQLKK